MHANVKDPVGAPGEPRAEVGPLLLLSDALEEISSSLDYDAVLDRMAAACVPSLADACAVDVVADAGQSMRRAGAAHVDTALEAILREASPLRPAYIDSIGRAPVTLNGAELGRADSGVLSAPTASPAPSTRAIREPNLRGADGADIAVDVGRIAGLLSLRSVLVIPIRVRGRSIGLWLLGVGESGRGYSQTHLPMAQLLARAASVALENALLYKEAQASRAVAERAAARTDRLQSISVALSSALMPSEVSTVTLEGIREAFGACAGAIGLVTEDGRAIEIMKSIGEADGHLRRSTHIPLDASLPVAEAVRTGAPVWVNSPQSFEARYAIKPPSGTACAGIPLIVNGRVIGGISLIFAEPRFFDEDDRDFAATVAQQCTLALERACLFDAERRARQQIAFLADANVLLGAVLEHEDALSQLAQFTVPFLADMCAIDVIERGGSIRRVGVAHADPELQESEREAMARAPLDRARRPVLFRVIEEGRPEIIEEGAGVRFAVSEELFGDVAADLGPRQRARSAMLVPLLFEGRVLGVISLGSIRRRFGAGDLAVAEPLARRAAVAIDRARLLREAEDARQAAERATLRVQHLHAITAAASEALTPQLVATAVIQQAIAKAGACAGGFAQLTEDEASLELIGVTGYSTEEVELERRIPVGSRSPIADAVRERASIFLDTAEQVIARYPSLEATHRARGHGAMAVIPLLVEARAIGALGLVFPGPRAFGDADRSFMNALGTHCAQALQRARSYEAERRAHIAADEANRLKDEFLATLSHELRTPLTAILGWARMLRTMKTSEAMTQRALATIERNASLQSRLIDDLLDASRIITGKLRLDVQDVELGAVIQAAVETVSHAAHAKDIHLRAELDPSVGLIEGDASRIQQIVWNLLSNAIKFTPQGGVVEVRLDQAITHARIRVIDSGPGIEREFLPFIFDRFRQGESAITRKHGGLGLGLAIVRSLVELHGGAVQAESAGEGKGATFIVRLPLPAARRVSAPPPVVTLLSADAKGARNP